MSPARVPQGPRETWARAVEPEPSVTITDETFFGHGWQPMTIAVLQAIWFLPAGEEFGVDELVGWFRALGWKSANGRPLGEDAVRRELALIRKAGYIRAYRLRGEGGQIAGMRYEISKRPKPPQEQIEVVPAASTKPQVAPCASNDRVWSKTGVDKTENRRSHHVPPITGCGDSPDLADQEKPQVAPCASNGGFPPVPPPEEVDTSSPSPLTPLPELASGRDAAARAAEEAAVAATPEQLAAAVEFLQELPGPWAVGRVTAQRYAPLLVESATAQGWELDDFLAAELTKNPGGAHNPQAALKTRIRDLVRRRRTRTVPAQADPPAHAYAQSPVTEAPPYCRHFDCDEVSRLRSSTDSNGLLQVSPCPECHPSRAGKSHTPA
ncbi:hypothetical protein ACWD4K_17330 [Streptomyces gelaticus]